MKKYDDIGIDEILFVVDMLCDNGSWNTNLTGETLVLVHRKWGYYALVMAVEWECGMHLEIAGALELSTQNIPYPIHRDSGSESLVHVFDLLDIIYENGTWESTVASSTLLRIFRRWGDVAVLEYVKYTPDGVEEPHAKYVVN